MATIADVAKRAGVSKSTVSNVVGNRKYVSETLKKRVYKACRELHYVPSYTAAMIVTKKTGIIGLFLDSEVQYEDYLGDLIKGAVLAARERAYKLLLYSAHAMNEIGDSLQPHKEPIDAAILINPRRGDVLPQGEGSIPHVVMGRTAAEGMLSVDADNRAITRDMTQKLFQLGHRRFLYVGVDDKFTVGHDRLAGFYEALDAAGIGRDTVRMTVADRDGTGIMNDFCRHRVWEGCTAVIVPSDLVGERVYAAMDALGLRPGQELSVASLGGAEIAPALSPPLSTVRVDYETIGRACVEQLLSILDGGEGTSLLIPSKLCLTESIGPPVIGNIRG